MAKPEGKPLPERESDEWGRGRKPLYCEYVVRVFLREAESESGNLGKKRL